MTKKKILVLDDDEGILESIFAVLEYEGYNVHLLNNPQLIKDEIKSFQPDVILLDFLLSGKDGTVISEELKKNKETEHIPLIMMSAHPLAPELAKKCGVDAFLSKPFDIETLISLINQVSSI